MIGFQGTNELSSSLSGLQIWTCLIIIKQMPFQTQTIIKHQNMQEYVYKNDLVFYIPYSILGKKIYAHDPTPYSKCDQASKLR